MRVLFAQKMAGTAGSELYLRKIIPSLRNRGIDCEFLVIEPIGNEHLNDVFVKQLQEESILVHRITCKKIISFSLLKSINKIYTKGNFDIFHSNLIHSDFWSACIKLFFNKNIKIVSVKHGYDETFQKLHGFNPDFLKKDLFYIISKFSNKYINYSASISDGLTNLLQKGGIVSQNKIETIYYGFDFSDIKINQNSKDLRFSDNQIVIVSRLVPVKQHHLVIDIIPEIKKEIPDIKLVIVGTGSEKENLEKQVKALGVEESVVFTGFKSNIHDYMYHSDIKILPSSAEGFGAVILEAWYNNIPVITFDIPAPNEIITNGFDGFLIPPFDKEVLKEKIIFLLKNKDFAQEIGKNGNHTAKTKFALNTMLDKTIAMYQRVLS